jgi:ribosome-binding factor A
MSIRTERVAGVIRETITELLACGGVKDPRVQNSGLITVTHVRVAADLGVAWVSVSSLGGAGVEQTVSGLRAAAGYLRGEVGKRLHARRLPELRFEADTATEREARVEAAFREIEAERAVAAAPTSAAPGSAGPEVPASAAPGSAGPEVPASAAPGSAGPEVPASAAPGSAGPDAPVPGGGPVGQGSSTPPTDGAVPEETAFDDTERVEVPYPASIEPWPSAPK